MNTFLLHPLIGAVHLTGAGNTIFFPGKARENSVEVG